MHQLRSLIQGDDLPVDSCKGATVFDSMESDYPTARSGASASGLAVLGQQDLPLHKRNKQGKLR